MVSVATMKWIIFLINNNLSLSLLLACCLSFHCENRESRKCNQDYAFNSNVVQRFFPQYYGIPMSHKFVVVAEMQNLLAINNYIPKGLVMV